MLIRWGIYFSVSASGGCDSATVGPVIISGMYVVSIATWLVGGDVEVSEAVMEDSVRVNRFFSGWSGVTSDGGVRLRKFGVSRTKPHERKPSKPTAVITADDTYFSDL